MLQRRAAWLERYGGKISSEWFFSKALQILDEAPEVYAAAELAARHDAVLADDALEQVRGVDRQGPAGTGHVEVRADVAPEVGLAEPGRQPAPRPGADIRRGQRRARPERGGGDPGDRTHAEGRPADRA